MIKPTLTSTLCLVIQITLTLSPAAAQTVGTPSRQAAAVFNALVEQYFDFYFQVNPTAATQAGFHDYDSKLEDFSHSAVEAETSGLTKFREQFGGIQRTELSEESAGDLDVITSAIGSRMLELQTIQMWRKDPDFYPSSLANSMFVIMSRKFAPPAERLRSVIEREKQFPRVIEAARENLRNPPREQKSMGCRTPALRWSGHSRQQCRPDVFGPLRSIDGRGIAGTRRVSRVCLQRRRQKKCRIAGVRSRLPSS